MQGYWCRVANFEDDPPIIGPLQQEFNHSYPSLDAADQAALAFPGIAEIAQQFQEQPFTAICTLLEMIKANKPLPPPLEGD